MCFKEMGLFDKNGEKYERSGLQTEFSNLVLLWSDGSFSYASAPPMFFYDDPVNDDPTTIWYTTDLNRVPCDFAIP